MTSNVRPRWRAIPPAGLPCLLDILLNAVPNLTVVLDREGRIVPIAGEFSLLAADRGVALEIGMDVTAPAAIDADADRFAQVLENLTANALKFAFRRQGQHPSIFEFRRRRRVRGP